MLVATGDVAHKVCWRVLCLAVYYFISWLSEEMYTVIQESRIVEPKDPGVNETVKVKERGKVYFGKVAAVGTRADVEARMRELEGNNIDGSPVETNGELSYNNVLQCAHGRLSDLHEHIHF